MLVGFPERSYLFRARRYVLPSAASLPKREDNMARPKMLQNVLIGATAALFVGGRYMLPSHTQGPVMATVASIATGEVSAASTPATTTAKAITAAPGLAGEVKSALDAFSTIVPKLSSPQALNDAIGAYYAFKTAHPNDVKKPYLYFVDYGLPSTTTRGYVLDMSSLSIVEGPFTVAHGRGSSTSQFGVPTHFSNSSGSKATSLGLYVAQQLYAFHGHTGGSGYSSIGLKLEGVSTGFNDKAGARGVVAHGAPYVTPTRAGRSEGCPAMEPARAQRLLPKLANGGMVFLYAPNSHWLAGDPWLQAAANQG